MNSTQNDAIVLSLEQALRSGFSVEFRPCGQAIEVTIKPVVVTVGTASHRLEAFAVVRDALRDAAGNALQTVTLECALDREARRKAAE